MNAQIFSFKQERDCAWLNGNASKNDVQKMLGNAVDAGLKFEIRTTFFILFVFCFGAPIFIVAVFTLPPLPLIFRFFITPDGKKWEKDMFEITHAQPFPANLCAVRGGVNRQKSTGGGRTEGLEKGR